jgi:hypothetical protein
MGIAELSGGVMKSAKLSSKGCSLSPYSSSTYKSPWSKLAPVCPCLKWFQYFLHNRNIGFINVGPVGGVSIETNVDSKWIDRVRTQSCTVTTLDLTKNSMASTSPLVELQIQSTPRQRECPFQRGLPNCLNCFLGMFQRNNKTQPEGLLLSWSFLPHSALSEWAHHTRGEFLFQDTGNSVEMAKGVFLVSTSNLYQTSNGKVT